MGFVTRPSTFQNVDMMAATVNQTALVLAMDIVRESIILLPVPSMVAIAYRLMQTIPSAMLLYLGLSVTGSVTIPNHTILLNVDGMVATVYLSTLR